MSNSALLLGIYFIAILVTTASASCLKSITCPCCSSKVNNTHCVDALPPRKQTCDRWANCQTCKTNSKICETYPPRRSGPTCRAKDKKMYSALGELDDESTLHYYIGSNNATDKYFSQGYLKDSVFHRGPASIDELKPIKTEEISSRTPSMLRNV